MANKYQVVFDAKVKKESLQKMQTQIQKTITKMPLSMSIDPKVLNTYKKVTTEANKLNTTEKQITQQKISQKKQIDQAVLSEKALLRAQKLRFELERKIESKRIIRGTDIDLKDQLKNIEAAKSTQQLSVETARYRTQLAEATKSGHTFGQMVEENARKFASWITVTTIMVGVTRAFHEGLQTIKELDTAMINLQKVTDETDATYSNFLKSANETAISLGNSTQAVIDATTEFARLGYSIREASELAENAIVFSNIGEMGIQEATTNMIAIMKAFNIEAKDSIDIVDKLNNIGNNFAISSAGIAEALKRSASALSSANNTLEESIGLITASNESVQDSAKVGTAMKTLSARLRGVSYDGEDLANNTAKLEDQFNQLGLTVYETDNTFKSSFDILKDLKTIWGDLDDETQAYLSDLIAGKRQLDVFSGLMNNFGTAIEVSEKALTSQGSALIEQAKHMESLEARTNKFSQTFVKAVLNMSNTGGIKFLIDFATAGLEVVGVIGSLATSLPGLVLLFGAVIFKLVSMQKALLAVNKTLFTTPNIIGAVVIALTAMNFIFNAINKSSADLKRELDLLGAQVNELTDEVKESKEAIKVLEDVSSATEEIAKARKKLLDTMGDSVVKGYNSDGEAIFKTNEELRTYIALKEKELELKKEEELKSAKKTFKSSMGKESSFVVARSGFLGNLQQIEHYKELLKDQTEGTWEYNDILKKLKDSEKKVNEEALVLNELISKYGSAVGDATPELKKYNAEMRRLSDEQNKGITTQEESKSGTKKLSEAYSKLNTDIDSLKSAYDTLSSGEKLSADTMAELIDKYPTIAKYINNTNDLTLKKGQILKDIMELDRQSYVQELENSKKSLENKQSEIQAKIDSTNKYYGFLFKMISTESALGGILKAAQNKTVKEQENILEGLGDQIDKINAKIKAYSGIGNILGGDKSSKSKSKISDYKKTTTDAFKAIQEQVDRTAREIDRYNNIISNTESIEEQAKAADTLNEKLKEQQSNYHDMANTARTELGKVTDAFEDIGLDADVYEYGDEEQIVEIDASAYNKFFGEFESKRNSLVSQRVALEGKSGDANKKQADSLEEQISHMDDLLKQMDDGNAKLQDSRKNWSDIDNEIKKTSKDIQEKINKKLEDYFKQQKKNAQDQLKDMQDSRKLELDALEKEKDTLTEKNQLEEKQLNLKKAQLDVEKAKANLANVQAEKDTAVLREGKWVYEARHRAVMEAQDQLATAEENQTKAQESLDTQVQLNRIQKDKDEINEKYDKKEERINKFVEKLDNIMESQKEEIVTYSGLVQQLGEYWDTVGNKIQRAALEASKIPGMSSSKKRKTYSYTPGGSTSGASRWDGYSTSDAPKYKNTSNNVSNTTNNTSSIGTQNNYYGSSSGTTKQAKNMAKLG